MISSRQRNDGLVAGAVGADGAEMIADVDQDAASISCGGDCVPEWRDDRERIAA
jgi:hypothetical protein